MEDGEDVITQEMREELRKMGKKDREINDMSPEEARSILKMNREYKSREKKIIAKPKQDPINDLDDLDDFEEPIDFSKTEDDKDLAEPGEPKYSESTYDQDDKFELRHEQDYPEPVLHKKVNNNYIDLFETFQLAKTEKEYLYILNKKYEDILSELENTFTGDELEDKILKLDDKKDIAERNLKEETKKLRNIRNKRNIALDHISQSSASTSTGVDIFSKLHSKDILEVKNDIWEILKKFPSSFNVKNKEKKKDKSGIKSDVVKNESIKLLDKIFRRASNPPADMFINDPEGLEKYNQELANDYTNYSHQMIDLVKKSLDAKMIFDNERKSAINPEDVSNENRDKWIEYSKQANDLLADFRKKYDPKEQEKPLQESEFRDQNWYSKKFADYMSHATTLPGAPASITESLQRLSNRSKFISSSAKYPDVKQVIDDQSMIDQVIRGVKPIAHTKTHRKEISLSREDSRRIAYVLAPTQMGGGVIWYHPEQRAGERPYDERILGLSPETDKEDRPTTKPYNPLANDANLNIVELYIWNNIANKSDPKIYNFINGLCLGYPRDYVLWFCESKYGMVDNRKPEQTFWGRMLERFRYCINAGVNGYGRPGSIKPDGMFSKIFKSLTPNFLSKWTNKILGTSDDLNPHQQFAANIDKFTPVRTPEKTEFEEDRKTINDPIIESICHKLDNL